MSDFITIVRTLQQYTYRRGIHYKLDSIKTVLARLGDPQNEMRYIHIAGTNGKGSTVAFLSSALQAAGFKVGTYTSPHLISYTERIAIHQKPISEPDFCRLFHVVERQLTKKETLTEFEILTAMAFLYFQEQRPDFVVLETGLGGRLDATNVITPLVSVITRIDYDHQAILGNTLAEIAFEKAGIIKRNVPVVTILQQSEVMAVLKLSARKNQSLLTLVKPLRHYPKNYAMQGGYQKENLALARAVLAVLKQQGVMAGVSAQALARGLQQARMAFRYQIIRKQKRVLVVDAAHNPSGISVLIKSLKQDFSNQKPVVLISILKTKNASDMLGQIFKYTDAVYYCEWSEACCLYKDLQEPFPNLKLIDRSQIAAFLEQQKSPLCVITGSIYFLGIINAGHRFRQSDEQSQRNVLPLR